MLGLFDAVALRGAEVLRFLFRDGAAAGPQQGEDHLFAVARQAKVACLGKAAQGGEGAGFFALEGFGDFFALGLHVGGRQAFGNVAQQRLHPLLHAFAQRPALACGQAQRARALGAVEVVQVAQVGRYGAAGGGFLHGLAHERGPPRAHIAQHKQVVVGLLHGQAKACGFEGALLANPGQRLLRQGAGVGKAQTGRVDVAGQLGRGQLWAGWAGGRGGGCGRVRHCVAPRARARARLAAPVLA